MTITIESMYEGMRAEAPHLENRAFHLSRGNALPEGNGFLYDTPHGYWGGTSDVLPKDHSARFLDAFSAVLDSARHTIDVVTLGDITGEFRARLFASIKNVLYSTSNPITVRIFLGMAYKHGVPDTAKLLVDMKAAIGFADTLSAYVGCALFVRPLQNWSFVESGWNHAKLVAVDGKHLLVGGHNWLGGDVYLGHNPVFDLSVRLHGAAAHAGATYADHLWDFVRAYAPQTTEPRNLRTSARSSSMVRGEMGQLAAPAVPYQRVEHAFGPTTVLAVGQPGLGARHNPKHASPGLMAAYSAIEGANRVVNLSQQNLGMGPGKHFDAVREFTPTTTSGGVRVLPVGRPWPRNPSGTFFYDSVLFEHLVRAMNRGVQVNIITTNGGAGNYTTGESVGHIYRAFGYILQRVTGRTLEQTRTTIRAKLSLKTIMSHGHIPWTSGNKSAKANHAKFWSVDDELFYVGSHNLYPSVIAWGITGHLDEWGVVVGGEAETRRMMAGYFDPLFASGFPTPFEDSYLDGI